MPTAPEEEMLRAFVNRRRGKWDKLLPLMEFAYNNSDASLHQTDAISPQLWETPSATCQPGRPSQPECFNRASPGTTPEGHLGASSGTPRHITGEASLSGQQASHRSGASSGCSRQLSTGTYQKPPDLPQASTALTRTFHVWPRGPSCGSEITWLLWMLVLRHVQGDKECW